MNNQTPELRLKVYSILFVILAVLDVVQIVIGYALGTLSVSVLAASANVDASLVWIGLIILYAVATVIILLKLFLGLKGYRQSQGEKVGTLHIKLAWVGLVIIAISLIGSFVNVAQGVVAWYSVITPVISLCLLAAYIKDAKAIKQA